MWGLNVKYGAEEARDFASVRELDKRVAEALIYFIFLWKTL